MTFKARLAAHRHHMLACSWFTLWLLLLLFKDSLKRLRNLLKKWSIRIQCIQMPGDRSRLNLILLLSIQLLTEKHLLALLVLSVMSSRQGHLVAQDVIYTNTSFALYLLLSALFMLLAHVHDSGRWWAVELLAVHALEVLLDLTRHTPMLAQFTIGESDWALGHKLRRLGILTAVNIVLINLMSTRSFATRWAIVGKRF